MLCQVALLLLLSSLQPGSLHEIDSESTAVCMWKEKESLLEGYLYFCVKIHISLVL